MLLPPKAPVELLLSMLTAQALSQIFVILFAGLVVFNFDELAFEVFLVAMLFAFSALAMV
jgi:hypothetical protein